MVTVHTLVKNEARFVWFSVMSVIDHVDKVLLWDTGSTDGTIEILKVIKKLYPSKVSLRFLGDVSISGFKDVRQKMLDETETDWFIVVDGDEIWWESSISKVIQEINVNNNLESIVVPTYNLVGDIFHYQEEVAGLYRLAGKIGHYSIRAVNRKIPGLSSKNPHGTWGWVDSTGKMVQDRDKGKIHFVDAPYLHASFLQRSGDRALDLDVPKRKKKMKYEIGIEFARDFYYPESLFKPRPNFVSSPWQKMTASFYLRSLFETPLRKLKRRILPQRIGY